jgi:hypothetical protein
LFAGLVEAPANFPSSFKSYCLHASNRNAPSSGLKYFMRLRPIGVSYSGFWPLTMREFSGRFAACTAAPPWAIYEGKLTSNHFR